MSAIAIEADAPTDKKTAAIVDAARQAFLARGFDAASMDQIALAAGVSKRTVYNRFRSKEELFGAAITESCANLLPLDITEIETSLPPAEFINELGRQFLHGILAPEALSLKRIAAFEAERTPAIGRAYMENGPKCMVDQAAPILTRLAEKGVFNISNVREAIWQLGALITEPLYTQVLMGDAPDDLDAAIDEQVARGVDAFMKIFKAE